MNSTISTATATTTATTATSRVAYLNYWIRLNSSATNATEIASLALRGKRNCSRHWSGEPLRYPDEFIAAHAAMTPAQLRVSEHIARSFGHLWADFESPLQWADHFNNGCEDGYNPSNHPLPTPEDETASGRYKWSVNRLGVVDFKINRPQGTACRVTGTLTIDKIEITKLAMDRHLVCLFQQLQAIFGLTSEDAIERIYSAKGFSSMGIRGGELHRVVMTA